MKIAFLFAGQYRPIPKELLRHSIQKLTKEIDYDIFCYSWDEPGESLDHREEIPKIKSDNDSYNQISSIFSEFNLKEIYTESYDDFVINLPKKHRKIFNSKIYHKGTIFALPQIYTLSKCYKLLGNKKDKYDLIFLDADKRNYLKYLNFIIPLLRKKGVLISDNVLWSGKVVKADDNEDLETQILKKFNQKLSNHKDLETVLLPIRDGISISMKV